MSLHEYMLINLCNHRNVFKNRILKINMLNNILKYNTYRADYKRFAKMVDVLIFYLLLIIDFLVFNSPWGIVYKTVQRFVTPFFIEAP